MTVDKKYSEMIQKGRQALDSFADVEPEVLELMKALLPHSDIVFEESIRNLLGKKISEEQKAALSELNYAYMEFVVECKKSFPREDVGKIVDLISAFHGLVGLFLNKRGDWNS